MPDQYAGEVPALFVVPAPDAVIDVDALKSFRETNVHEAPARPRTVLVIATLTFNRPDNLNAASASLMRSLEGWLRDVVALPGLRCVILTGTGRAFCAGFTNAFAPSSNTSRSISTAAISRSAWQPFGKSGSRTTEVVVIASRATENVVLRGRR